MRNAGIVCTTLGGISATMGMITFAKASQTIGSDTDSDNKAIESGIETMVAGLYGILSVALLVPGIPLFVAGNNRVKNLKKRMDITLHTHQGNRVTISPRVSRLSTGKVGITLTLAR